jgi:membrane protease YdiL (CAAX protease family)
MTTATPRRTEQILPPQAPTELQQQHRLRPTAALLRELERILAKTAASPAGRLFGAIWLASVLILVVSGQEFPLYALINGLALALLSLVTIAITRPAPHVRSAPEERPRLWLQVGLTIFFIALTAWRGLAFHRVLSPDAALPLWSSVTDALQRVGDQWFGNGNHLANPVTYVVLPLPVLLLAGARLRELGFGPGDRVGRVLLLWCAPAFVAFAYALLSGQLAPARLAGRLLTNLLNSGFFEEFLFRGALQTRLRGLAGPSWALVLQAMVFGVWHLWVGFADTGYAGWVPALASTLANQAVIGLAYGVVFERTRNLLAPSIVHVVGNTL